ncbi:MAG: hypothetical protein M3319_04925 [Actinomycetota bacterium]|nr:hypothetical protein [Actinomycetota bacterium]MDQ3899804.1 hypothetical protein [Actinomycetota bacterium]
MQWTLSDLTGEDGELIERLCYTLDQACERYADVAGDVIVQGCLCIGAPVQRGEILARDYDAALTHLARQALQLVEIGVSESFLIRALRDRLTKLIDESSDVGNANRMRAEILDDIGQELSPEMVAGMQPMEADEVSDRWALREYWATANAESYPTGGSMIGIGSDCGNFTCARVRNNSDQLADLSV